MDETTDIRTGSSSKIDQLLHLLRLTPENEKSLVFSQFTTFLDKVRSYVAWIAHLLMTCPKKIADVLDKEGSDYLRCLLLGLSLMICLHRIPYLRFDGKMSAKRQQETLETFCVPLGQDAPEIANIQPTPIAPTSEGQQMGRSARSKRRGAASARDCRCHVD